MQNKSIIAEWYSKETQENIQHAIFVIKVLHKVKLDRNI